MLVAQNPAYRLARLFAISYEVSNGYLTELPNKFGGKSHTLIRRFEFRSAGVIAKLDGRNLD